MTFRLQPVESWTIRIPFWEGRSIWAPSDRGYTPISTPEREYILIVSLAGSERYTISPEAYASNPGVCSLDTVPNLIETVTASFGITKLLSLLIDNSLPEAVFIVTFFVSHPEDGVVVSFTTFPSWTRSPSEMGVPSTLRIRLPSPVLEMLTWYLVTGTCSNWATRLRLLVTWNVKEAEVDTSLPDSVHFTNRQPEAGVATTVTSVFSLNVPLPDTEPPWLGLANSETV